MRWRALLLSRSRTETSTVRAILRSSGQPGCWRRTNGAFCVERCWNADETIQSERQEGNMVITKDFVFIHMPKTGGTFVKEMLRKVYLGYRYRSDESDFTFK